MFSENRAEIIVGIVVFIAVIILTIGIIWGKKVPVFSKYNKMRVVFDNGQGVEPGDPVMVCGIKNGEVKAVKLSKNKVIVEFWLNKDVKCYSDAKVYLDIHELMGGKQISLYPGSGNTLLDAGQMLRGEGRGDIRDLFSEGEIIMHKVDSLLTMMNSIIKKSRFIKIADNLDSLSYYAKEMMKENRKSLYFSLKRIDDLTRQFAEDSTLKNLNSILYSLDSTAVIMKSVVKKMNNENGTFGKLLKDGKLYDQLLGTTARIDSLVNDIKENPGKYIHFSIF